MACITVSMDKSLKKRISLFPWVNWSEVGREEALKKEIFDRYIKTGKVSDKEWQFCEEIDWHPVDWLPLKEKYVKELEQARKETPIRLKSVDEIFEEI